MAEPEACPHCGRRYEGGKTLVRFLHCLDCVTVGRGHLTWWCLRCGWRYAPGHHTEGWMEDPGVSRVTD